MLTSHEKWIMSDQDNKNNFWIEVNWKDDEKINKGKILKFTFPDGKIAYIKREHLHQIIFAIGTPSQQRKLIPQKIQKVRWYETVLSIKAKKDIQKGEDIIFPIKLTLPPIEEEIIGEIKKKSNLLIK